MNRVLAILASCFIDLLGFIVAALAASAFLHVMFLGAAGFELNDTPWLMAGSILFSLPFAALFVAYFAFLPALAVILVAEILSRRDWLFYALGGAAAGLAVMVFLWGDTYPVPEDSDVAAFDPLLSALLIAAGMIGGFAYWLVAGRLAGSWRRRQEPLPRG